MVKENWLEYYKYILKCKHCHKQFGSDRPNERHCHKCSHKAMGRRFGQKNKAIESFTV